MVPWEDIMCESGTWILPYTPDFIQTIFLIFFPTHILQYILKILQNQSQFSVLLPLDRNFHYLDNDISKNNGYDLLTHKNARRWFLECCAKEKDDFCWISSTWNLYQNK